MSQKMLVIAAHLGDFVWRSGGSIAKYADNGNEVHVIVLSFGLRGESKNYWDRPDATMEDGIKTRHEEGLKAAEILGVTDIQFLNYEDYPMIIDEERLMDIAERIRKIGPDFILTHDKAADVFNPDHNLTRDTTIKASKIAADPNVLIKDTEPTKQYIPIFGFEPHNTEICNFKPDIYINITDYMDKKIKAMDICGQSQKNMPPAYVKKAETRAAQCALRGNTKGSKYAEAFSMFGPVASYGHFAF